MNDQEVVLLSVRMTAQERSRIDQVAQATGRTRSNVTRRLVTLLDNPEVLRMLGIEPQQKRGHD